MYNYNPNGKKVYNLLEQWLENRDYISWAVLVADFAHYHRTDSTTYVLEKWWKFCDELAEYILWEDPERANEIGLAMPEDCKECGETTYQDEVHASDCSLA